MKETHPRVDAHYHFWDPTRAVYPWMVGEAPYYQDKASMDSNAEAARQLRDQVVSGLGAEALLVNEYQIAVVDIPSPITTG